MDGATAFGWPLTGVADATEALARAAGFGAGSGDSGRRRSSRHAASAESADTGVHRLSSRLDFEAHAVDVPYADVERTLETAGPALLKVNAGGDEVYVALEGASGRFVYLLTPDGGRHRVPLATAADWLRHDVEAQSDHTTQVDAVLADANVPASRRAAARRALLGARLGATPVTRCWMLRPAAASSLWHHLRHAGLQRRFVLFLIAYVAATLASMGAWWLIGAAALEGRFDVGTLLAWSFLILSVVPLGLFAMWSQGVFIVGVSGTLKMQLLAGALKLDPDETRHAGVGQHLARVIESESVEALTLAGGFFALASIFDLLLAMVVLITISAALQLSLLALVLAVLGGVSVLYFRYRQRWTQARLFLTQELVEQMVGHRTRLVQESPAGRHDDEDAAQERYLQLSRSMDRAATTLFALPRVWLLAGIAGLAPQMIAAEPSVTTLAVALGATLLAFGAITRLTTSVSTLADAGIGWQQVRPLLQALWHPEPVGHLEATAHANVDGTRSGSLMVAQDLTYRHRARVEPVLHGCGFRIAQGDRIHLTGASGGGKSTLVSLLTGLRVPDTGLLLLDGLDRATLGARPWRRRVAAAPQFHENHLFTETLAFNLLMGRQWPPTAEDLEWAETTCRRLGLGPLLDRMPAGLFQVVGETGWQLSHGERSRVFMARALLQGAELVVLDESFAELDPESLRQCLPQAAALSKSLLVVAHQ